MKVSCILIDNATDALKLLESHVLKTPGLYIKGQFNNTADALAFLQDNSADVIFTEIDMPGISGLELAGQLPRSQKFVFTTTCREYALHSFNYHVVDYLLKPIVFARFSDCMEKIAASAGRLSLTPDGPAYMFAKSGGNVFRVNYNDILFVKGEKEYVSLNFKNRRLLIYKRMKAIQQVLPPSFQRVHLSYIANTLHIDKVASRQIVFGELSIPLSNSYRKQLLQYLNRDNEPVIPSG